MIQRLGSGSSTGFYVRAPLDSACWPHRPAIQPCVRGTTRCDRTMRPAGALVTIPELPEASGVAVSRRIPGRLWTHNDSGQPILMRSTHAARVTGQLRVYRRHASRTGRRSPSVRVPAGSCVYVGDIGDNDARRKRITIYRVPEPAGTDTSVCRHRRVPRDLSGRRARRRSAARHAGPDHLHRHQGRHRRGGAVPVPARAALGATHQLERVGKPATDKSGADRTHHRRRGVADGQWVVLRTSHRLTFYRDGRADAGNWRAARTVDLKDARRSARRRRRDRRDGRCIWPAKAAARGGRARSRVSRVRNS